MGNIVKSSIMSLMDNLQTTSRIMKETYDKIQEAKIPMDILDMFDELKKASDDLSKLVSLSKVQAENSRAEFLNIYTEVRRNYNIMMSRISERKNMDLQPNTSIILYDENNIVQDITFSTDRFCTMDELMIRDYKLDPLIRPEDYSVIAIINRMELFSTVLDTLDSTIKKEFADILDKNIIISRSLLDLRDILNSGEAMNELATKEYSGASRGFVARITEPFSMMEKVEDSRNRVILIFRLFEAIEENFQLFNKATDAYTSIILESVFNPNSSYDLL